MTNNKKHTGFAIALAWPQTYCKQPGAWYDSINLLLGINKNNYYQVGHAALVLVDSINNKAYYFDFGRYHTPYQHGRVRGVNTDDDLIVHTKPILSTDGQKIENYNDILYELQNNPACHGEGDLYASYCSINFDMALEKVHQMQAFSPIPYGPFKYKGSNCSRFVNTAILAGKPQSSFAFKLKYKVPLTPTPLSNINALPNKVVIAKQLKGEPFCPIKKLDKHVLISTIPQPEKHTGIPSNAQWLSGEGAGSWFHFDIKGTGLHVSRYSPQGVLECNGIFENPDAIDLVHKNNSAVIIYPSNCKTVFLKINDKEFPFHRAM